MPKAREMLNELLDVENGISESDLKYIEEADKTPDEMLDAREIAKLWERYLG